MRADQSPVRAALFRHTTLLAALMCCVLLAGVGAHAASAVPTTRAEPGRPKASPGRGPVAAPIPLTSRPRHGLKPGQRPPIEPPKLRVDDRHRSRPAVPPPVAGPQARSDEPAGPRATHLHLLPGLVAGDTSLQLFFDAPESGWATGRISLYAADDTSTELHSASFTPAQLVVCGSPAKYCWTLDNAGGWGLQAGKEYVVTVTLTTADGQSQVSEFSAKKAPRVLPVPPPVPAEQLRGPAGSGGSSGRTGAQPVLRGTGVDVATGAFTQRAVDAALSSAHEINAVALRSYSSADTSAGLLGIGWQLGYEARISPKPGDPDAVIFVAEDGTRSTYTRRADGSYAAPPGVRSTLTAKSGGGWQLTTPNQRRLTFDSNGRLQTVFNERGKGVTLTYGTGGRLAKATDVGGRVLTFTTTDPGRISEVKLPDGRKVSYSYQGDRLREVRDPDGAITRYDYDTAGRLVNVTDALGHRQLTNTYDAASGRVTAQADAFGKVTRFEWDAAKQESKVTDPDGVVNWDGFRGNALQYSQNGNGDTTVRRYDERLNVAVVADPLGRQVELGYDGRGNTTARRLHGGDPVVETASYDGANNLLRYTDGRGKPMSYTYNDFDQPVTGTDGEGHVTKFAYHEDSGLLTTVTDPLGHVTRYDYDAAGNPTAVTDPTGAKTTRTFDATGRLKSVTDPRGNVSGADPKTYTTTYDVYDGRDRVRRITDPLGHFRLWEYDAVGRLTTYVDGNNHHTTYRYDDGNRLTTLIDADLRTTKYGYTPGSRLGTVTDGVGNGTTYTYDTAGRLATEIAPRGQAPGANPGQFTTTYGYDFNGNLTSVSHPYPDGGMATLSYAYDGRDQLTAETDALGNTTRYGYDEAGNVTTVTDPLGQTSKREYDGNNQVTRFTDERGKNAAFGYDGAGNLKTETSPTGAKTTYGYDAADRLTSITSPRGNADGADPAHFTTRYGYDRAGNPTTVTDPLGHLSKAEYDPANRITRRIDANGHATRYGYDNADQLTRIWGPDASDDTQATVNTYDHVGNLIARTNPRGFVQRYTYDGAGRLASSIDAVGNRREFTYDPNGNIATIVTARGTSQGNQAGRDAGTIVLRYDNLDRLRERVLGNGPTYSYGYDAASRLTSLADAAGEQIRRYDPVGRLKSVTRGSTVFGYDYDAAGNLTKRTLPDGSEQTLGYDDDSRPASLVTPLGDTRYGYDPDSNLTQITLPGGSTHRRTYDNAGRMATLAVRGPAQPITAYALTRDKVGNPTRMDTTVGGSTRSDAFSYDKADRLTAMCYQATTCASAGRKLSFTYDLVGNRLTRSKTGPGGFTEQYAYNAADQLTHRHGGPDGTVTYDYDQDGNTTRAGATKIAYDLDDQVASIDDGRRKTAYTEDAAGNRLHADTTTTGGSTSRTTYQWDVNNPLPLLVAEQTAAESRRYAYHADGSPLSQQVGGSSSLIHPDPYGNTAALTDIAGTVQQRYTLADPFGELAPATPSAADSRLGFHGQYRDPLSGAYHLRARDYGTGIGRFHSVDPLANRLEEPAVSGYAYGHNNPLTRSDPSGLCDWWDVACGADASWEWFKGEVQEDMGDATAAAMGHPRPTVDINSDGKYTAGDWLSDAVDCDRPGNAIQPGCRPVNEVIAPGADIVADVTGLNDYLGCFQGDTKACAWMVGGIAAGFGLAGLFKLAGKAIKAALKLAKRADDVPVRTPTKPGTPDTPPRRPEAPETKNAPKPPVPAGNRPPAAPEFAGKRPGFGAWTSDLSNVTGKTAASRNRAIDAVIKEDFPDLRLTFPPRYSPYVGYGVAAPGQGTQIGAKSFTSRWQLRDTLVHEELHHRWWARGITGHHPKGSAIERRFYDVVARYMRMRGWPDAP